MEKTPHEPSLDEIVNGALGQIAAAMKRAGRTSVRVAIEIDDLRFTLGAKRVGRAVRRGEVCTDLPPVVAGRSKATRRVYRALRDARSQHNGSTLVVWQQDIFEAIRRANPADELSIRSVHRALKELLDLQQVAKHPTQGYRLGAGQPSLPFCDWQPSSPSQGSVEG